MALILAGRRGESMFYFLSIFYNFLLLSSYHFVLMFSFDILPFHSFLFIVFCLAFFFFSLSCSGFVLSLFLHTVYPTRKTTTTEVTPITMFAPLTFLLTVFVFSCWRLNSTR